MSQMSHMYITDGKETFSQVCSKVELSANDLLAANYQIRDLLSDSLANNTKLPAGTTIFEPGGFSTSKYFVETEPDSTVSYRNTGGYYGYGKDGTTHLWRDYDEMLAAYRNSGNYKGDPIFHINSNTYAGSGGYSGKDPISHLPLYHNTGGYYGYGLDNKVHMWKDYVPALTLNPYKPSWANSVCSYLILTGGKRDKYGALPVIPQEFSENNRAEFSSVSLLGRSVDYEIYNGSSREVSFSLELHTEIVGEEFGGTDYVKQVVADFESANYPTYGNGAAVKPPEVVVKIGRQFKIRGILTGCSTNWKTPIVDNAYSLCTLSLSIKETTGPYSREEVATFKGFRE